MHASTQVKRSTIAFVPRRLFYSHPPVHWRWFPRSSPLLSEVSPPECHWHRGVHGRPGLWRQKDIFITGAYLQLRDPRARWDRVPPRKQNHKRLRVTGNKKKKLVVCSPLRMFCRAFGFTEMETRPGFDGCLVFFKKKEGRSTVIAGQPL